MNTRNGARDAYTTQHSDFIGDIWVRCPACGRKAIVKTPGYQNRHEASFEEQVRFVCSACGKAMKLNEKQKQTLFINSRGKAVQARVLSGENSRTDPFFGFPLWLIKPCLSDVVWAYNPDHLQFLEEFIASSLRRRPVQPDAQYNRSIGSRLPKWMTSGRHRDRVLKSIRALKAN